MLNLVASGGAKSHSLERLKKHGNYKLFQQKRLWKKGREVGIAGGIWHRRCLLEGCAGWFASPSQTQPKNLNFLPTHPSKLPRGLAGLRGPARPRAITSFILYQPSTNSRTIYRKKGISPATPSFTSW